MRMRMTHVIRSRLKVCQGLVNANQTRQAHVPVEGCGLIHPNSDWLKFSESLYINLLLIFFFQSISTYSLAL